MGSGAFRKAAYSGEGGREALIRWGKGNFVRVPSGVGVTHGVRTQHDASFIVPIKGTQWEAITAGPERTHAASTNPVTKCRELITRTEYKTRATPCQGLSANRDEKCMEARDGACPPDHSVIRFEKGPSLLR